MSAPKSLSRRGFLLLAALMGSVKAFAGNESENGGDNGIGGTGFRPGDNGLGGTGFIGSIRKFGSVYVNGERIAYPADAIIEIDGARATTADMRLGQVARLVAERVGNVWTTHRIVIVSEAIGPVERIRGKKLDILGQRILLPSAKIARALKVGDRIAVGGLRRPDQTIVASSVERVPGGLGQIAGLVQRHPSGGLRIGGQKIAGVSEALAGSRIVARGALDNGVFVVGDAQNEAEIGIGGARNVSVETWVSRRAGGLETAGGVRVEDRRGGAPAGVRLVVIDGAFSADGSLVARRIEQVDPRRGFDAPGGGPNGGPGGGGQGGRGPGGTGGPGRSGGAPGGRPGGFLQHGPERGGLNQRRFGAPGGGAFPDAPRIESSGIGTPGGENTIGGNPSGGLPPTGGSPFGGPGAFPGGPGAFPGGPGAFPGGPGGFTGPPGGRFR